MADFTVIENEGKVVQFDYENSDGTTKDVSGDTFSLAVENDDGTANLFTKSDSDFDKSSAASGTVKVSLETGDLTTTGVFNGQVKRDAGTSDDVDIETFTIEINKDADATT